MNGDFNRDVHPKNMQEFVVETGLCDVLAENQESDETLKHKNKCVDLVLATEGILRCTKIIELIEFYEIVELDYRGHLIEIDIEDYFAEELVEGDNRMKKISNLNRKNTQRNLCLIM